MFLLIGYSISDKKKDCVLGKKDSDDGIGKPRLTGTGRNSGKHRRCTGGASAAGCKMRTAVVNLSGKDTEPVCTLFACGSVFILTMTGQRPELMDLLTGGKDGKENTPL